MVFPKVLSLAPFFLPYTLNLFLTKLESTTSVTRNFADDTQLHKASQPTEFQCLVSDFESCLLSVKAWMVSNKLKLNDEKTEAMLVGSRQDINLTEAESIQIDGKNIFLNAHVKNLGVFLDNTLTMEQHISRLCCSAYLAMRQIASIRRHRTLSSWRVHLCCPG